MPKLAANQPPPPHYYADNLRQLLGHVQHHYGDVLNAQESQFISRVERLSVAGQRLFARLLGRKGPWIRIDRLRYDEVAELAAALQELQDNQLITINGSAPADALLGLLNQAERGAVFPAIHGAAKRLTRHRHIELCLSRYPDALIAQRIAARYPWVCVADYPLFHRCQLLFFGDAHQDLTTFVLQDLGLLNYEAYSLCAHTRQFVDRDALDRYLRLLALSSLSHRVDELGGLAEHLRDELTRCPDTRGVSRLEQRSRDKTLNRLGRWFERRGDPQQALTCYAHSRRHPARERRVRLLQACDDTVGAARLLDEIRIQPWSADEQDFAERFGRRRRCEIPTSRVALASNRDGSIEHHAMAQLTSTGDQAWHLENSLPLGLAGLAYWPVVFAEVPGAFVNPFQSAPVDLHWEDFLAPRKRLFDLQEAKLEQDLAGLLRDTFAAKHGLTNRLVHWSGFTAAVLEAVLGAIPPQQIHRLARHVLQDLGKARVGFPDLFVVRASGGYEFVEVKGPTDQLQPAQRIWFQRLAGLQMPARVLKFSA